MAKKIIWSKNAEEDRLDILQYWFYRTGDKTYSKKLYDIFNNAVDGLINNPLMGKATDKQDVRYLIREKYLIFYKTSEEDIQILHIWYGRRNPEDLKKLLAE